MEKPASSKQLLAENEDLRQQLHVFKNKFEIANKTIFDLSEELEQVVVKSAEEKKQIRSTYEEQLKAQKSIIDQLKAQLEEKNDILPGSDPAPEIPATAISDQQELLSRAKQDWENEEKRYLFELELLQEKFQSTSEGLQQAKWELSKTSEELQQAKERLEYKQSDLLIEREKANELRTLLEAAQQQNALLSAELAGIRSGSSNENTKGNSLFGEVADQRTKVLKTFATLKAVHIKLKQEHADCPRQIRELRDINQQSERLYGQCLKLIKAAEYDNLFKLREQNGDLHEQLERALARVRYLEHEMATKSADWVNKLVLYYTEEMRKLEQRLRTCQFQQREAMELRQDAVKEAWMWRLEAQRLRTNALNVERAECPTATKSEDPANSTKIEIKDVTEVECSDKENEGISRSETAATPYSKEPESDDEACSTVPSVGNTVQMAPKPVGALQEIKQENPEPDTATFKIVPLKCYKITDLMKLQNKGLNKTDTECRANEDEGTEKPQ
ncbi:protein Spindly-B [Anopheles maculipalpis]|uniref:protein Spindly-B n=1 Tax=Anopheles maculipalpis TaxID=1496333 RepID=UPI0021590E00|nr:protein Spindly-B [Anopheles maculipalpis]